MDKPYYSTGETVWFKAYTLDVLTNLPKLGNSVLRVDLLDTSNSIIDSRMLKIDEGNSIGEFNLPDSLSPGKYTIRAYTNWMRNAADEFFYRTSFDVVKTYISNSEISDTPKVKQLSIKFFPEGGDLIAGVPSIVGFKILGDNGLGVNVSGEILNGQGKIMTSFKPSVFGMGKFLIKPEAGDEYYARVNFGGKDLKFDLPDVLDSGCSMRINNGFNASTLTVAISSKDIDLHGGFIIGHQNGSVFFKIVNNCDNASFGIGLQKEIFPEGICHLTFFDKTGKPLTERVLVANQPQSNVIVQLEKNQSSFKTRQKAKFELKLSEVDTNLLPSNLSVSITPADIIKFTRNGENIRNYLLLSSDLRGYVEQPEFYFDKTKDAFSALDNLMLTQGWRRFEWDDVLNEKNVPLKHYSEEGITVSGQLLNYYRRSETRKGHVSISVFDSEFSFMEGDTDEEGRFVFTGMNFLDSTKMLIKGHRAVGKKGKTDDDVFIKMDPYIYPKVNTRVVSGIPFDQEVNQDYLLEQIKMDKIDRAFSLDVIVLDEIEIFTRRNRDDDPYEREGMLYREPSARLEFDSIPGYQTALSIFDLIRGRVAGVFVRGQFPNYSISIRSYRSMTGGNQPLYILDGIWVRRTVIGSLNPADVLFIDFLKGADAAIFGSRGANGVVAVYTRTKSEYKPEDERGSISMYHPGYDVPREFYTPDYEIPQDEHAKPDIRSTLYWNPSIVTGSDGTASFSFYTSDQQGTFDLRIEGVALNGNPIFYKDTFSVK
jgi:hypothetical protein